MPTTGRARWAPAISPYHWASPSAVTAPLDHATQNPRPFGVGAAATARPAIVLASRPELAWTTPPRKTGCSELRCGGAGTEPDGPTAPAAFVGWVGAAATGRGGAAGTANQQTSATITSDATRATTAAGLLIGVALRDPSMADLLRLYLGR